MVQIMITIQSIHKLLLIALSIVVMSVAVTGARCSSPTTLLLLLSISFFLLVFLFLFLWSPGTAATSLGMRLTKCVFQSVGLQNKLVDVVNIGFWRQSNSVLTTTARLPLPLLESLLRLL